MNRPASALGFPAALAAAALALVAPVFAPAAAAQGTPPATTAPAAAPELPRVPPPADLPRDRPLRAAFLVLEGVSGTELVATYDVLQHTVAATRPGITVYTVSPDGGVVRTAEGLSIDAHHGFGDAPTPDILVVPGGTHNLDSDLANDTLIAWLKKAGGQARYVLSLRSGVFLLARAGLLQGRLATTFPGHHDTFAQMFPKQELRRDVSFVHDGPAITSIGGARSHDVALYLVDHLYGEEVARKVADGLVVPWPPGTPQDLPALVVRYRTQ